jgi:outer membrane receptor for ferrienterochelin and colicin
MTVLLSLVISPSGLAQELDLENSSLDDLLNIKGTITASKQLQRVADAPATVIVVTHEQIVQRGYMNVKDVLADLPGMETIENNFAEYGTLVPFRGTIGNNKILLMINGMPLNPPNRENLMLREDQSVRFAKRVEVVYGPGSALYGTDAVSAIINIITVEPQTREGSLLGSYGTRSTGEGAVSYGTPLRNGYFLSYAQFYESDGMNLSKEYPTYFKPWQDAYDSNTKADDETLVDRKKDGLNLFAAYKTGDTTFQYWMRESERTSSDGYNDGGLMYSKSARWKDHSDVARMENLLNLKTDLSVKTSLTYSYYRIDPETQYVFPVSGSYFYGDNKYGRGSAGILEQQVNWKLSSDLSFVVGYEYRRSEGVPKSSFANDYDEQTSLTSQTGEITYVDGSGTHTAQKVTEFVYSTLGVYAQGDWTIHKHLRAIAGARYNEMSLSNDKPIVPRIGLIAPINERTTFKLIHSQAFVYPALYFQYNVFDNGAQVNIANLNLKPEKSQTTELNFLYDARPWAVSSSLYYNKQKDIFLVEYFDHASPGYLGTVTVGGNSRDLYQTTNSGNSESYGLDTLTQYRFGGDSSAFAAVSYVTGQTYLLGTRSRLDRISNVNVRLGMSYVLKQNLTISPRLSWRSDPLVPDTSKSGSGAKASREHGQFKDIYQLDLFASYAPFKSLSFFTRLNNLTNHKYLMRGFQGTSVVPADTFSAQLGAEYIF